MTGESSALGTGSEGRQSRSLSSVVAAIECDRQRVVLGTSAVVTALVAVQTVIGMLYNLPYDPVAISPTVRGVIASVTALAVALGLVVFALAVRQVVVRVGLLFAGVFGLLVVVNPAATVPAVIALAGGGTLALFASIGRPRSYPDIRKAAVATAIVVGVTLSLASTTGIVDGGFRGIGATTMLAGFAGIAIQVGNDWLALVVGAATAGVLIAVGTVSPFVLGSVLLVEFGVIGAPLLLVALAVGGLSAASVAGIRRGESLLAIGAVLLLVAGMPVTLSSASAVLLGATLALPEIGPLLSPHGEEVTA